MILRRGIEHRIQMPEKYESVVISAEVTVDTEQGGSLTLLEEMLEEVLYGDLKKATELADENSYIHNWE